MLRFTGLANAGGTFFPTADATEVLAFRIAKKNIGAAAITGLHGFAAQLAFAFGQRTEWSVVVFDFDEEINVFGNVFVSRQ